MENLLLWARICLILRKFFNLLHSRHACEQVKNQKDLTTMILHLCKHPELAKEMGQNCLDIIRENRGATRRNTQELRQLFNHIILFLKKYWCNRYGRRCLL